MSTIRTLLLASLLLFCTGLGAQININTSINATGVLNDFKGSAANIAALSSTPFTDAVEGQFTWIADINEFRVYNGSSWVSLPGGSVSDAQIETGYNNQVAAATQNEAELGTETAIRRFAPNILRSAIEANSSRDFAKYLISGEGTWVRVDTMTKKQRGQALHDINDALGDSTWLYLPSYDFWMPQATGGFTPKRRVDYFSIAHRSATIVGDSTHGVRFAADQNVYRVNFTNVSFMTDRAQVGDNWDAVHFEDQTILGGTVTFNNCHVTEADRDGIYVGANWLDVNMKAVSMTGNADIGRYNLRSNAESLNGIFYLKDANILLESSSLNNGITIQNAFTDSGTNNIIDNGTNNVITQMGALDTQRDHIGGVTRLVQDYIDSPQKIVFYSPMDSLSWNGTQLKDYSENNSYGYSDVGKAPEIFEDPDFGQCLKFDGTDDYIEVFRPKSLNDGSFFCSFLMYVDAAQNGRILKGTGFDLSYKTTNAEFILELNSVNRNLTYPIDILQWYHIGLSVHNDVYTVWVNGESVQTFTSASIAIDNESGSMLIGAFTESSGFYQGKLKDILIYNGYYEGLELDSYQMALSSKKPIVGASLQSEKPSFSTSNIIYYNPMDDASLSEDYGPNGADGTFSGSPSLITSVFGSTGLDFDGAADYITVPHNSAFNADDIYIGVVAKADISSNRRIIQKANQFDLFWKNDGVDCRFYYGGGSSVLLEYSNIASNRDGSTFHFGIGHLADTAYLLVNGVVVDTAIISGDFDTNTNDIGIGNIPAGASYWNGIIDEVVMLNNFNIGLATEVYKKAISANPILQQKIFRQSVITDAISTANAYTDATRLVASATLDFGSTAAQTHSTLTIPVAGASIGEPVTVGSTVFGLNGFFYAEVTASGIVTVYFHNYSAGAIDPASGTFKITVHR